MAKAETVAMTELACKCFGNSGLHASTFRDSRGRECCDLCGHIVAPKSDDVLTAAAHEHDPTIEQLRRGLRLAVNMLSLHEPPDSRAVSDEFVALAAMDCGSVSGRVMDVIEAALSRISPAPSS